MKDKYWAKNKYSAVDPLDYETARFRTNAGKLIDEAEKKAVLDLLEKYAFHHPPSRSPCLRRQAFGHLEGAKKIKILDVATGPGRLAFYLEDNLREAEITGVDINENMLRRAREIAGEKKVKRSPTLRSGHQFFRSFGARNPAPSARLKVTLPKNLSSGHSGAGVNINFIKGDIYHLPFKEKQFDAVVGLRFSMHLPDINKIFQEFSRVLKKDGILIFDIFNLDSVLRLRDSGYYTIKELEQIARKSNFYFQEYKGIILLGETIIRRCPEKLLSFVHNIVEPPKWLERISTKLVLAFKKL